MRILDDELILSPSDLTGFAACAHLTQLELQAVRGQIEKPERDDPLLDVLSKRGTEHEQAQLAKQHAEAGAGRVVTISTETRTRADLLARAAETEQAMRDGADVIYQAVFVDGRWAGYADFVWKVDRPSPNLGAWSYEVADAKLARSVKAAAVLQCCAYSDAIARIQGVEPERLHVITGDGETHSFRVADYSAYYRRQKADLEATVLDGVAASAITLDTYPHPVDHCSICRWGAVCATQRRRDDHLSLVAGMSRSATRRLTDVDITTRRALAAATVHERPPRMAEATYDKLRRQAALQVRGEGHTPPLFELLPVVWPGAPGGPDPDDPFAELRPRGLAALPAPSPGDLFLDLEGDPYVDGGLEYLWGVTWVGAGGAPHYRASWAHDRAAEKLAFEAVIDLIVARRAEHPGMHVYHYAPYEPSAIRRLMGTHGTRESEVDDLLTGEVFVDLYSVVRHSLRLSSESYSLKQVEKLYMQRPPGEVMDAGSSIVAYEEYLREPAQDKLDAIERYNQDDCDSTLGLREWFEARRAEVEAAEGEIPRPVTTARDRTDLVAALDEVDALADALIAGIPDDPTARTREQQATWLLAQLLHW
ncbi:MAG: TM0106 family RecB-like putative nuclease, partial [Acidimicrobiia bacterium]